MPWFPAPALPFPGPSAEQLRLATSAENYSLFSLIQASASEGGRGRRDQPSLRQPTVTYGSLQRYARQLFRQIYTAQVVFSLPQRILPSCPRQPVSALADSSAATSAFNEVYITLGDLI